MEAKIKRKLVITIVSFALIFGLSIGGSFVYAVCPDDLSFDMNSSEMYMKLDGTTYKPQSKYEMPMDNSITLEETSVVIEHPERKPSGYFALRIYKSYDGNTWDQLGFWMYGDLTYYTWYNNGNPGMVWFHFTVSVAEDDENIDITNQNDVYLKLEIEGQTAPAAVWHFSKPQVNPIDDNPTDENLSNDNTKPAGYNDTKGKGANDNGNKDMEGNSPKTNDSIYIATMISTMAIILLMLLWIYIKRRSLLHDIFEY